MAFNTEPPFQHGSAAKTGVLLCNLGTPDAPTASALRRYLGEFLSDHRVVEIPKPIWWLILHGIILRIRPAKSAKKYASIWMPEGSPLRVWTQRQCAALADALSKQGHNLDVRYAMRYGNPSMASQLDAMKADGCTRILILPSYPQYSGTTTASVLDAVYTWAAKIRRVPEFRFLNNYHDDPRYTEALARSLATSLSKNGALPQKLVLSFHGVPERTLHLGDTYHCECYKTARLVGLRLAQLLPNLPADFVKVTFQSRFGKAKWLEPYTEPTLIAMAQAGLESVAVACPGFTVDCLETLEEISLEAREAFLHAGGKRFDYLPCLNDSPAWADGLASIAAQHLQGWPTLALASAAAGAPAYASAEQLAAQHAAAQALGAKS